MFEVFLFNNLAHSSRRNFNITSSDCKVQLCKILLTINSTTVTISHRKVETNAVRLFCNFFKSKCKHLDNFDTRVNRMFTVFRSVVVWCNNGYTNGTNKRRRSWKKMAKKDCTIWRVIAAWWNARTCARTRGLPRFVRVFGWILPGELCNPRVKYPRGTRTKVAYLKVAFAKGWMRFGDDRWRFRRMFHSHSIIIFSSSLLLILVPSSDGSCASSDY